MKKRFALLLVLLLLVTLCACDKAPLTKSGWNADALERAGSPLSSGIVSFELKEVNEVGMVIVTMTNNSDTELTYGEGYRLDVLLDGLWYRVPTTEGNWAFVSLAYLLPAGESTELTYGADNSAMYGDLPAGTYRIMTDVRLDRETEYLSVEFTLD